MDRFETSLLSIQSEIKNKIHCINNGGCIHFAYYLSKRLTELRIPHSTYFTDYDPIRISKSHFAPLNHVMIYIKGVGYIDGKVTIKKYRDLDRSLYNRLVTLSSNKLNVFRFKNGWNTAYNVNQNSRLEKIIRKHLTDDFKYYNTCNLHKE